MNCDFPRRPNRPRLKETVAHTDSNASVESLRHPPIIDLVAVIAHDVVTIRRHAAGACRYDAAHDVDLAGAVGAELTRRSRLFDVEIDDLQRLKAGAWTYDAADGNDGHGLTADACTSACEFRGVVLPPKSPVRTLSRLSVWSSPRATRCRR